MILGFIHTGIPVGLKNCKHNDLYFFVLYVYMQIGKY